MAATDNRVSVLLLLQQYRVLGQVQLAPDGAIWAFKHRPDETFLEVFEAQFFSLADGQCVYDAQKVEINRDHILALFREADVAYIRKD